MAAAVPSIISRCCATCSLGAERCGSLNESRWAEADRAFVGKNIRSNETTLEGADLRRGCRHATLRSCGVIKSGIHTPHRQLLKLLPWRSRVGSLVVQLQWTEPARVLLSAGARTSCAGRLGLQSGQPLQQALVHEVGSVVVGACTRASVSSTQVGVRDGDMHGVELVRAAQPSLRVVRSLCFPSTSPAERSQWPLLMSVRMAAG